jgi:hypothetical protein
VLFLQRTEWIVKFDAAYIKKNNYLATFDYCIEFPTLTYIHIFIIYSDNQQIFFSDHTQHQILLSTLFVARKALCLIIYREDVIGNDGAY